MSNLPNTLLLDIETAPILANVWTIWQENVGLNQIQKDWHMMSFCAKWLGKKKVFYFDQSKEKNIENDTGLLLELWPFLDKADIVVTQNGDRFDIPKIRSRMIINNIEPFSPFRSIDTKRVASQFFGFTSNKLEYMSEKLSGVKKDKHKEFPGFELWLECMKGNRRAWAEMRKYNIIDVLALEGVYLKMRPWIDKHPNVGVYMDAEAPVCRHCGGEVQKRGRRVTNLGIYQQYWCKDCGGYSRDKVNLLTKDQRKLQLVA